MPGVFTIVQELTRRGPSQQGLFSVIRTANCTSKPFVKPTFTTLDHRLSVHDSSRPSTTHEPKRHIKRHHSSETSIPQNPIIKERRCLVARDVGSGSSGLGNFRV